LWGRGPCRGRSRRCQTTLYRHFRTKDDLIAAFLHREDEDFWKCWDNTTQRHHSDAEAELEAQLKWIGERVSRPNYRGCPQLNVAAEFPDLDHPARAGSQLRTRENAATAQRPRRTPPARRSAQMSWPAQLSLLINGAFVSSQMFSADEATPIPSWATSRRN